MNKNLKTISIILGIASLIMCLLGTWYAILIGIIATLVSIVLVKDEETISKTLQPVILSSFIVIFNLVFGFIVNLIKTFINFAAEPDYAALANLSRFSNVVNFFVTLVLVFFITISVIMAIRKKDIPVVDKIANKLANISSSNTESVHKLDEDNIEITILKDDE